MNAPFRRYLRILFGIGLPLLVLAMLWAMVTGNLQSNFWVFRCSAAGYGPDTYLGSCADKAYADYERGAAWLGTEPKALQALRDADVVALGNSRAVAGFSAEGWFDWFQARGMRFYNLAFNGEFDLFPISLLEKLDLRPRVIVVNVDYFFYGTANLVGKRVMGGAPDVRFEYEAKQWIQQWHRLYCSGDRGLLSWVCGDAPAQYRSGLDGRASYGDWPMERRVPIEMSLDFPRADYPHLLEKAKDFKRRSLQRGACLILSVVPTNGINHQVAQRLAEDLSLPLALAEADGLYTYDGSHMSPDQAQAWFQRVSPAMDKALTACSELGQR